MLPAVLCAQTGATAHPGSTGSTGRHPRAVRGTAHRLRPVHRGSAPQVRTISLYHLCGTDGLRCPGTGPFDALEVCVSSLSVPLRNHCAQRVGRAKGITAHQCRVGSRLRGTEGLGSCLVDRGAAALPPVGADARHPAGSTAMTVDWTSWAAAGTPGIPPQRSTRVSSMKRSAPGSRSGSSRRGVISSRTRDARSTSGCCPRSRSRRSRRSWTLSRACSTLLGVMLSVRVAFWEKGAAWTGPVIAPELITPKSGPPGTGPGGGGDGSSRLLAFRLRSGAGAGAGSVSVSSSKDRWRTARPVQDRSWCRRS